MMLGPSLFKVSDEGLIQGGNYPSSMVAWPQHAGGVDPFERAFCTPGLTVQHRRHAGGRRARARARRGAARAPQMA